MSTATRRKLTRAAPAGATRIEVGFDDGSSKVVDVAGHLWGPVFRHVAASADAFAELYFDPEVGTVCWPGNVDLAPELFEDLPDVQGTG